VLKKPEPLQKDGRVLQSSSGKQWRVLTWEGPERLIGEWWKDPSVEGFRRDYYRVVTEGGEQLWVFADYARTQGERFAFFLHGYFD
jgi:protein ImuB